MAQKRRRCHARGSDFALSKIEKRRRRKRHGCVVG